MVHARREAADGARYLVFNNATLVNGTIQNTALTSSNPLSLGCNTGGGEMFAGDIAEVLLFDHNITGPQRAYITDYLHNKFGITKL